MFFLKRFLAVLATATAGIYRHEDGTILPVLSGGDGPDPAAELVRSIEYVEAELERLNAESGDETMDEETSARFEEGVAFVRDSRAELERLNGRRAVLREFRDAPVRAEPGDGGVRRGGPAVRVDEDPFDLSEIRLDFSDPMSHGRELRTRAMRAVEQVDTENEFLGDEQRAHVQRLIRRADTATGALARHILITGSEAYRAAWAKVVAGADWALEPEERKALTLARAASLTTTAGGFAVPFTLDPTIILTNDGTINPFRGIARQRSIVTDDWNGITSAGVTASWDGEAAQVSDDAPTLAQPTIPTHKAQAFVPFSIEIGQDWASIEADTAELFVDARERLEGAAFTTGSGTNQPTGVITDVAAVTASRVAATTNNSFGLVDVYAVHEALPARHRKNRRSTAWMADLPILNDIRQFDNNGGNDAWVDLGGDTPPQLLGRQVHENSDMDGTIGTGDDDVLIYGDFDKYQIVDRVGMAVEFIPHLFHTDNNRPSGQRGWYAWWRVGAEALDANAFRLLRV